MAYELIMANIMFKKQDKDLITYKNGISTTQIDYFLSSPEAETWTSSRRSKKEIEREGEFREREEREIEI